MILEWVGWSLYFQIVYFLCANRWVGDLFRFSGNLVCILLVQK